MVIRVSLFSKLFKKFKQNEPIKEEKTFIFEMNVGSGAYKAQGSSLEECKDAVIDVAQKLNTKTPDYIN